MPDLDTTCIQSIRFLAVDSVEQAGSGHPGMPLGAAPMAYVLWDRFLKHNPGNPHWPNRDRFILSAGHGSALLYALLHLTGYDLPIDELKNFRQWGSLTPGHPEYGHTSGVETTTGPLGQGFANGVGMALAERFLAESFNRPDFDIIDHHTYAIVSDGDLMEGVASEAASLAGTLGLGKIVYLYDDNRISIDGPTDLAFREDVAARFEAYGWHVEHVPDGNDLVAIEAALQKGRDVTDRPSLVRVSTHIGYGSPKQDSASAHGEPLGSEAARATKAALGWPVDEPFLVPEEAGRHLRRAVSRGQEREQEWIDLYERFKSARPEEAARLTRFLRGELPEGWTAVVPAFEEGDGPLATRQASGTVLNALAEPLENLLGGSADLTPSNKTYLEGYPHMAEGDRGAGRSDSGEREGDPAARNVHFGVREHAMQSIVNGLALHGGVIPYGATFLVFSDYMRPALRLASLMGAHTITVFTHDSVALGEDGPTHQPVEHVMALRAIPGLTVIRPADANETAAAWRLAVERRGPVALVLTRQKLPVLEATAGKAYERVSRGAYVLSGNAEGGADLIFIATGSEVPLALAARALLLEEGVEARVVSMPSWELFEEQGPGYKERIFPAGVPKISIEAGISLGWRTYVGDGGEIIGLDRFGASAPGAEAYAKLGFDAGRVADKAREVLARRHGPGSTAES